MKKLIIDEKSATIKNKRNAKRDIINFYFAFVIIILAIFGKELFDIHINVIEQNKEKQNIVLLITIIDMFVYSGLYIIIGVLIQKVFLHDTYLKLTDYDNKAILNYGVIHITTEEKAKTIEECGYMCSSKKWFLSILRKSTIWFYPLYDEGIEAIQDAFNRKKKFIKGKLDKSNPVLIHIRVNEDDIKKFRTRFGQLEHNDEAMCYLDKELHYSAIEIYRITNEGILIK